MRTVCVVGNVLTYPRGGGHVWAYLNWALGARELGFRVVWLEPVNDPSAESAAPLAAQLRSVLARYGLGDDLALCATDGSDLPPVVAREAPLTLADAAEAELLLAPHYGLDAAVIGRFRRSALVNIDPGLLELWVRTGVLEPPKFDAYFTTAEPAGDGGGIPWQRSQPCVALSAWEPAHAPARAPFTTVTHWFGGEWVVDGDASYSNDKRDGFLPFLELPRRTPGEFELAIDDVSDWTRTELEPFGWRVRLSYDVASTPWDYHDYIAGSRGEFSAAKPSCLRLANGWVSDRTLCYLASGRPAVVQDTGPNDLLAGSEGLLRFSTLDEAAAAIDDVLGDYERHCRTARLLAEERFAADRVVGSVIERALA